MKGIIRKQESGSPDKSSKKAPDVDMIHAGELIRAFAEKHNISTTDLAERIGKHRENIYAIYKRKTIDLHLLIGISIALNHNFVDDIAVKTEFILQQNQLSREDLKKKADLLINQLSTMSEAMKDYKEIEKTSKAKKEIQDEKTAGLKIEMFNINDKLGTLLNDLSSVKDLLYPEKKTDEKPDKLLTTAIRDKYKDLKFDKSKTKYDKQKFTGVPSWLIEAEKKYRKDH